jgi:uncharacterized repeat protein (TIGR04076 family)
MLKDRVSPFPRENTSVQSMMPVFQILAEKDRLDDHHWVKKVRHFRCPDPDGGVVYRLEVVDCHEE